MVKYVEELRKKERKCKRNKVTRRQQVFLFVQNSKIIPPVKFCDRMIGNIVEYTANLKLNESTNFLNPSIVICFLFQI